MTNWIVFFSSYAASFCLVISSIFLIGEHQKPVQVRRKVIFIYRTFEEKGKWRNEGLLKVLLRRDVVSPRAWHGGPSQSRQAGSPGARKSPLCFF